MTNSLLFALWARDKDNAVKYRALTLSDSLRFVLWAKDKSGGGGTSTTISGTAPLILPNALKKPITSLIQYGEVEQDGTPTPASPVDIVCNNGTLVWKDRELPVGYTRIQSITFGGSTYYETNEKLYGSDIVTITIDNFIQSGQNLFGCYSGTSDNVWNFSMYVYGSATGQAYWRYGQKLYRPTVGSTTLHTLTFGAGGTDGFKTNVSYDEVEFETTDTARIGALPNSSSPKFDGDIVGNVTVGNRLKYIPCIRQSDGKIGYYELMNQKFLEPQGSAPVAGDADTTHMALEVVGTPEEISIDISGATMKTASAVSLFETDDYQDTQNIITGAVTRKVGIAVLDGTEDWAENSTASTTRYRLHIDEAVGGTSRSPITSNQFVYASSGQDVGTAFLSSKYLYLIVDQTITTVEDFKAYLAAHYAASTPVIILYPLAEATTKQATPQHLCTYAGDNTISVTAEVSSIEFDVTYSSKG